jgi:hypothetical protein
MNSLCLIQGMPWRAVGVDRYATFLNNLLMAMGRSYNKLIQWLITLTHEKPFHQLDVLGVFQAVALAVSNSKRHYPIGI